MPKGDHLFVQCVGYSHHGIDCGDGRVIHFESDPWRKLAGSALGQYRPCIRETSLEEFSQGRPVMIRQYELADDPDTVVERALQRVGETDYDLIGNNCEHFAVWCKTGQPHSSQVSDVVDAMKPLAKNAAWVPVIMRSARYLPIRLRPLAYGAAVAVTAGSFLQRYVENRWRTVDRGDA
jgi:hypothetical protein